MQLFKLKSIKNFILMISFIFSNHLIAQCLSGQYTIGGNNPDYPTFNSASAALTNNGVCGPVTFKIRAGIYRELVRFNNYPGASEINRVTFEPEQNDSTSVELQDSACNSSSYVIINFNNASFISIRKLVLRMVAPSCYSGIIIYGNSSYNVISNCTFYARKPTTLNNYAGIISLDNGTPAGVVVAHNVVENNYFQYGANGVNLNSSNTTNYGYGNQVVNNVFEGQVGGGIFAKYQKKLKIKGNSIRSNTTLSEINQNTSSILINYTKDSLWVSGNKVCRYGAARGIDLLFSDSTKAMIDNNYVFMNSTDPSTVAVLINAGPGNGITTSFAYNTIRSKGIADRLFTVYSYGAFQSYNNNIVGGSCNKTFYFYIYGGTYTGSCNNFFAPITNTIQFQNSNYSNAAAFYAATGRDSGSVTQTVLFADNFGHELNDTFLLGKAIPLPGLMLDIDGVLRDTLHPSIGCVETMTIKHNDINMLSISPSGFNCGGSNNVNITFQNLGMDTIQNAVIGWEVNGTPQTPFNYIGPLVTFGNSSIINIGTFSSIGSAIVKVYPISINGVADENNLNDTTFNDRTQGSLNGIYTVGNYNCDFPDMVSVKNALQTNGVCGPVRFRLKQGAYYGSLLFQSISGVSSINTVTFEPFEYNGIDGVTIFGYCGGISASIDYILKLDHAHHIYFSKISIKALELNPSSPVAYTNPINITSSSNIYIDSCYVSNTRSISGTYNTANFFSEYSDSIYITNQVSRIKIY